MHYLKQSNGATLQQDPEVTDTVARMLHAIETEGEEAVRRYNRDLDGWAGDLLLRDKALHTAGKQLPDTVRDDLAFAHDRVRRFAQAQRDALAEFEMTPSPGVVVGQKLIPIDTAGCYVPGGRYAHAASAFMSVCTAVTAGVCHSIASTPANAERGVHPAILHALHLSGATQVLLAGGVQGIGALAFGIATGNPADVIVGPGNRYVAEAKRQLFGRVGIDVLAGPTENLVLADDSADPHLVAADLAGQAEHGPDSPMWLVTTSQALADAVAQLVPKKIHMLPDPARTAAEAAWRDFGEIVVAQSREEALSICDRYAPEHLQVQAADLDWWLARLRNYGSLFLGEETTVSYGDKCTGPNHILPTRGGARYSGGLSVGKFIKTVTYQRLDRAASAVIGAPAARISRLEGMEGHARSADARLEKYFPEETFELTPPELAWPQDSKS